MTDHTTPAGESAGTQPERDVRDLIRATLQDLAARLGLETWVLARRDGPDYVSLVHTGRDLVGPPDADPWTGLAWQDSFCGTREASDGPAVAPDVLAWPAYANLVRRRDLPVRAMVSVPVQAPDGTWSGVLCGTSRHMQPADLTEQTTLLELAAASLGALMACEVRIGAQQRRAERAELEAQTDALTGLGNRRALDRALASEEQRAGLLGSPVGIVVADLDDLKRLNDEHGHDEGDTALRRAAQVLRAVMGSGSRLAARSGGDEFVVLLPDEDEESTRSFADELRHAADEAGVGLSLGWSTRRPTGGLSEAWRRADAAMFADKTARRPLNRAGGRPVADSFAPRLPQPAGLVEDVDALLALVAAQLGLEVVYVDQRHDDHWQLRSVHTTDPDDPVKPGLRIAPTDSACQLLVDGLIPSAVPRTADVGPAAGLPLTHRLRAASHLGVPLVRSDGTLFGALCGFSRHELPDLGERDAQALRVVAGLVMAQVERSEAAAQLRHGMLARLDAVTSAGGPRMVFQPVVGLADGRIVGHEALSRFPGSDLSPAAWFAQAQEAGLDENLELAAVRNALAHLDRLPGFVAVNLSSRTTCLPALPRILESVDPSRVMLELTEHAPVEDYDVLRRSLKPLRENGVQLAVDDLGAGFSSLRHVLELLPDVIKLDISLVRNVAGDRSRQALARAMVTFAHATGARVTAEGVETEPERRLLRAMGVDLGQGFHLGRPEPLPA